MTGLGKAAKKRKIVENQVNGVIDVWTGLETLSIDVIGVGQGSTNQWHRTSCDGASV